MLAHLQTLVDGTRIVQIHCEQAILATDSQQAGGHLLVLVMYSDAFAERPADRMLSDCLRDNRRILQMARQPALAADCRSIGIGSFLTPEDDLIQALFVDVALNDSEADSTASLGNMFVSSDIPQIERLLNEMGSG